MMSEYPELLHLANACLAHFNKLPPEVQEKAAVIRAIHRVNDEMNNEIGRLEVEHGVVIERCDAFDKRVRRLRDNSFKPVDNPPLQLKNLADDNDPFWMATEDSDGKD